MFLLLWKFHFHSFNLQVKSYTSGGKNIKVTCSLGMILSQSIILINWTNFLYNFTFDFSLLNTRSFFSPFLITQRHTIKRGISGTSVLRAHTHIKTHIRERADASDQSNCHLSTPLSLMVVTVVRYKYVQSEVIIVHAEEAGEPMNNGTER